jgi:membrane-bound metal-dependent hydrolase YbcI (DUF457 family)
VDNLTHTLFALTLARTPLGRATPGTTAALVIGSNAPDLDIVTAMRGSVSYLQWHRGPTHGCLGVSGLAVLTAAIVWLAGRFTKTNDRDSRASFGMLVAVSMLGAATHVLMDFPTSYGTRLLSPFEWHWFAADWLPIIDIYLLIALIAGLVFGRVSPEAQRRNAAIVLVLVAANYGLRGAAHHRALTLAPRLFGPTLPPPCSPRPADTLVESWPRRDATGAAGRSGQRCLVELAAMPTFISPFRWRVVAHLSNAYELHDLDVLDSRFLDPARNLEGIWRTTVRFPNAWTPAVERAAMTRTAQIFLGFSRFPAARSFTDVNGATTVRWLDVRFAGGVLRLDQPVRRPVAFAVTITVGADGQIMNERLDP